MRDGVIRLLGAILLLGAGACGSDAQTDKNAKLLQRCGADSDCAGQRCVHLTNMSGIGEGSYGFCSHSCEVDDECSAPPNTPSSTKALCGTGPDGAQICMPECGSLSFGGISCGEGDRPIACEQLDDDACGDCGCPTGQACLADKGCLPLVEVGETCFGDAHCASGNCSATAAVCRVALATPCTVDDCDLCFARPDSSTWCSRECSDTLLSPRCGSGLVCTGPLSGTERWCQSPCQRPGYDHICPGECIEDSRSSDGFYCWCFGQCSLLE